MIDDARIAELKMLVERANNGSAFAALDFGAAARTAVPELLEEVERLRSVVADALATFDEIGMKDLAELLRKRLGTHSRASPLTA